MINGIIYKATNKVNGKVYIGQTVKTLEVRIIGHLSSLRSGKYPSNYFFRAMNKYGEDAFQWEEIDQADNNAELDEKEVYWIDFYNSNGEGGYNLTDGGSGVRGYKVTEEGIERRRNVLKEMWANGHGKHFPKGEDAVSAKHDNDTIRKVGEMLMQGKDYSSIAEECNINKSYISNIKAGTTWNHLFTLEEQEAMKIGKRKMHWLSEKEIIELRDLMLYSPFFNKEIARTYGISETSIYSTQNSKKWGHLFSEEDKRKIKARGSQDITPIENAILVKQLLREGRFNQTEIAWIARVSSSTVSDIKRRKKFVNIQIPENEIP